MQVSAVENQIHNWFHGAECSFVIRFDWQIEHNAARVFFKLELFQKCLPADRFAIGAVGFLLFAEQFIQRWVGLGIVHTVRYAVKVKAIFLQDRVEAETVLRAESLEKSCFARQRHGVCVQNPAFQEVQSSIKLEATRTEIAAWQTGQSKIEAPE